MRILVVEDERKIATFVQHSLKECGFLVHVAHRGDAALEIIEGNHFDAIVLDIMLPGRDGLSVLRSIRQRSKAVPVILLTARGEIAARLRDLLRRNSGENLVSYRVEDLTLDLATRIVRRGGRRIDLTTREFSLLECLMRAPGRVFTRTQLCERVWEYHFDPESNLVDVYIQRLRRKIDDGEPAKLIQNARGAGYRIGDAK